MLNVWVELKLCGNKNVLFGVFYRPPNSGVNYQLQIENSFGLATDTGIDNIIITGDFNLNTQADPSLRKVESMCQQNSLSQCITEPTNYTEQSSSIIDLLFISNESSLVISGVGEPFLQQKIRYRCPIFGIFKF